MIEIIPVKDVSNCLPLLNGLEVGDGVFVLAAMDGDTLAGAGALRMQDGYAVIERIATVPGFELLDYAIGKALLNFIERREVLDVVCSRTELIPVLWRLGFAQENPLPDAAADMDGGAAWYLNLEGYFTKHC